MSTPHQYIRHILQKDNENANVLSKDISTRLENKLLKEKTLLKELCKRPLKGLTEVRRDGKDNEAIARVIKKEFLRCIDFMSQPEFVNHMHIYAYGCWVRNCNKQILNEDYLLIISHYIFCILSPNSIFTKTIRRHVSHFTYNC